MSVWKAEVHFVVHDELLELHDGEQGPPPNDVEEWWGGDLYRALEDGIAEIEHVELDAEAEKSP